MSGLLQDRVAIVTGAASGIGLATATAAAREGARVLLADVSDGDGEKAAANLRDSGADARYVHTNVASEAEVEAMLRAAIDAWGRVDCAVNNAGVSEGGGALQETTLEIWDRTIAINLTGVFLCMKHELAAMVPRGGGAIVNVASGAGIVAVPGLAHYCASKHAVLGLTKTAAVENARTGVRVNAVCPGSVDTPMLQASMSASPAVEKIVMANLPGGRLGTPEEIAEAVVWLCSDRASFVTGETMLVDGGQVAR